MKYRINRFVASLPVVAALLVAACSFESANKAMTANRCSTDLECGDGSACRAGICVSTESQRLVVALRVSPVHRETAASADASKSSGSLLPAENSTAVEQPVAVSVSPFAIQGSTVLDKPIKVPLLVEVSGNIRYQGKPVSAEIRFVPKDSIPGMQVGAITATTSGSAQKDSSGEASDFIAQVLQNVDYNIAIAPLENTEQLSGANPALPPYYGAFNASKSDGTRLDIDYDTYSMQSSYFTLQGAPDGKRLKVYAVSPSSAGKVLSSVQKVTAGQSDSAFGLRFMEKPGLYTLVIEPDTGSDPSAGSSAAFAGANAQPSIYPIFRVNGESGSGLSVWAANTYQPVLVVLPAMAPSVLFSGYVELCKEPSSKSSGQDGGLVPISEGETSISMSLRSTELLSKDGKFILGGSFNATAAAAYNSETGRREFSVELIPGNYQVVVTPPADSQCGVFAKERQVPASADNTAPAPARLTLPGMAYIKGVLQATDDDPILGGTIQAQALGREGIDLSDQPSLTAYNRSSQATTDAEGAFRMPVDLGSYDVIAKPPAESRFGWQVFYDVNIGTRGVEFNRAVNVEVPITVEGKLAYAVSDRLAHPASRLKGAEISAFAVIEEEDKSSRTIEIGRTTADAEGGFKLLLAPSLKQGWY